MLKNLIAHPLTRGLDLNDPLTTSRRRQIISEKKFLKEIYAEWYRLIAADLPDGSDPVLEIGAGAGFMGDYIPSLVASEVFHCPNIDVVCDATSLPLSDGSLRAIVMTDVLHHIPNVESFFAEAARCVRPGGVIVMIEPWLTPWSKLIYSYLHHEPFEPAVLDWGFPSRGALSSANGALPWIVFHRDRTRFGRMFPQWEIQEIKLLMPFTYLLSGGVSLRSLMPGWAFRFWRQMENLLPQASFAMFARVVLKRGN